MVRGMEIFARHFEGFKDRYILIGGAACDLWLTKAGLTPRATKDLDIVIIVEAIDEAFVRRFWDFIRLGRYARSETVNEPRRYYRFTKPESREYPQMLELFSRRLDTLGDDPEGHLTLIPVEGDVSSLSAILLDDDCYQFILDLRRDEASISLLPPGGLIPLKAKAYLELKARKAAGGVVDDYDIAKHQSDVLRLALLLVPDERIALPPSVRDDLRTFLATLVDSPPDLRALRKSLGLRGALRGDSLVELIRTVYEL